MCISYLVASCHGRVHEPQTSVVLVSLEAFPDKMSDGVDSSLVLPILGEGDPPCCAGEGTVEGEGRDAMPAVLRRNKE